MDPKRVLADIFGKHDVIESDASVYTPPKYNNNETNENTEEEEEENSNSNVEEEILKAADNGEDKTTEEIEHSFEEIRYNTRALPQHAKTYQLEKFEKNALMILNHVHIEGYDTSRIGSSEDAAALERTFSKFGFEIERHDDLPKVEVLKKLKAFSSRDFTDYGCVAVAILTHGTNNGLLRANDFGQYYSEKDVLGYFKTRNKPTLVTKPIVVMIQACRGTSTTRAVLVGGFASIAKDQDFVELEPYYLPLECDTLVVHSSYAGKPAYRPANGSWFIQTLCKRIDELYKHLDFESIILEVKKDVAIDKYSASYNSVTDDMDVNKQMPVMTSTLIRKLHLFDVSNPDDLARLTSIDVTEGTSNEISCECYLDHFKYMKMCLSNIVQDDPKDILAPHLLKLASQEVNDEMTKSLLGLISAYFKRHCRDKAVYKFMHFYDNADSSKVLDTLESRLNDDRHDSITNCEESSWKNSWVKWTQSLPVRSVGICIGAYVIYYVLSKLK